MSAVSLQGTPQAKPYELWLAAILLALLAARLIANAFARTDLVFDEAQYGVRVLSSLYGSIGSRLANGELFNYAEVLAVMTTLWGEASLADSRRPCCR